MFAALADFLRVFLFGWLLCCPGTLRGESHFTIGAGIRFVVGCMRVRNLGDRLGFLERHELHSRGSDESAFPRLLRIYAPDES